MTSTTIYRTENGKTVKVESESEKNGSAAEKTADNKKQKSSGKTETVSDNAEVEVI